MSSSTTRDQPSGVVTLLFTDIEGSTRLLRTLPADLAVAAFALHGRVLREAFARHGGYEQRTEGDSFFVVFRDATSAVAAAVLAQRSLAAQTWPGGEPVRVRMGMHTGEPTPVEGDYVGLDVHRAARIAAAGHGGQVLVSRATRALAELPDRVSLRDLGEHRLKDLAQPEWIYELRIEGLDHDFRPLTSLETPTNLPVSVTPLLGRERRRRRRGGAARTRRGADGDDHRDRWEWQDPARPRGGRAAGGQVPQRPGLRRPDHRDGPRPGRRRHREDDRPPERAWPSGDRQRRGPAARPCGPAGAGQFRARDGGRRGPGDPPGRGPAREGDRDQSCRPPDRRRARVPAPAARCGRLGGALRRTGACDATGVRADPDGSRGGPRDLRASRPPAARHRARRGAGQAPHRRADPRAPRQPPGSSLGRTAGRAGAPADAPDTIAWSYDLLAPGAAALLRRASVFVGGIAADALESTSDDELETWARVETLLDQSLLRHDPDTARFSMLETIREFALEQAREAGELAETSRQHAAFFAELASTAEAGVHGPDRAEWRRRLEDELPNLLAALEWALETEPPEAESAAALAVALGGHWYTHGRAVEGAAWLRRTYALPGVPVGLRASLAQRLGVMLDQQADKAGAAVVLEEAIELFRQVGDRAGQARALNSLGSAARTVGSTTRARELYEEALAIRTEVGDDDGISVTTFNLAQLAMDDGDFETARHLFERSHQLDASLGEEWGAAIGSLGIASAAVALREMSMRPLRAYALPWASSSTPRTRTTWPRHWWSARPRRARAACTGARPVSSARRTRCGATSGFRSRPLTPFPSSGVVPWCGRRSGGRPSPRPPNRVA